MINFSNMLSNSFDRVNTQLKYDELNLIVLRGFTELMNYFELPSFWEHFNDYDEVGVGTYYLLAEEFQLMCLDIDLYEHCLNLNEVNPNTSFGNVVMDERLMLEFMTLYMHIDSIPLEHLQFQSFVHELVYNNFNLIYLDFNLFFDSNTSNEKKIFPINYEPFLGLSVDYYEELPYYGKKDSRFHGHGIIEYFLFEEYLGSDFEINVFDEYSSLEFLGYDKEADYETISFDFFKFLSKYKKLN